MAHLKLFLPSLTFGQTLLNQLSPHTALLSTTLHEDQGCDRSKHTHLCSYNVSSSWHGLSFSRNSSVILAREKVRSLRFIMDEDNDFQDSGDSCEGFVHALQLAEDNWGEIETVKSESVSARERKG